MLKFGECCLTRADEVSSVSVERSAQRARSKWGPRWVHAVWVGRNEYADANITLTKNGVVVSRTVKRVPESQQSKKELLGEVRGLPWDMRA